MRGSFLALVGAFCLLAWNASVAMAQESLLVGTWEGANPKTGEKGQIIITSQTLQFGADEPKIPYTARGSGGVYEIFIGGIGNPPAKFTFRDADNATLAVPGGPAIPITRVTAAVEATPPATTSSGKADQDMAEGHGLLDEIAAMMAPYGVATRYEPLNQSLETLLSDGWKLDQAAGASGAFTLLLTKGNSNALCVLVPQELGQANTALSDCRQLN
jgi:hypothetical protein